MKSFQWTRILTNEKFERAQLDFHGGFSNPKLACVLSVNIPRSLTQTLDNFRRDALACILEGWEFLMLIHQSHFIHSILVQECSDDSQGSSNVQLLSQSQYFLLGFTKGWRQNQRRVPSITATTSNPPPPKRTKPQEISRSNFIIKDFGKAKILKPISTSSLPVTTSVIRSHERSKEQSLKTSEQSGGVTEILNQLVEETEVKRSGESDSMIRLSHKPITPFPMRSSSSSSSAFNQLPHSHMASSWVPRMNTSPSSHLLDHGISELTSVPANPDRKSL
jgi:hypothetical protein